MKIQWKHLWAINMELAYPISEVNMKDLIIVGAGGFGRELLDIIKDINAIQPQWNIKGFLDDNPNALIGKNSNLTIIGNTTEWIPSINEEFALAIANPSLKKNVINLLIEKKAEFVKIIHPTARISTSAIIGKALVVYPNACIGPDTLIGDYVTLLGSSIGHDASIGDYTTISSFCDITGGCKIGESTFLASRVSIVPNATIGNNAYVGIGSVVINNVKNGERVFGYPAKRMEF